MIRDVIRFPHIASQLCESLDVGIKALPRSSRSRPDGKVRGEVRVDDC